MDIASDFHPYDDEQTYQTDASGDINVDPDQQSNHCEHCCHAHVVSLASQFLASAAYSGVVDYQPGSTPNVLNHAQAPPTPPPNA